MNWTKDQIPDLAEQTIIVTGANSGLGKETTRVLSGKGAHVIMAVRTPAKGEEVAEEIRNEFPKAKLSVRKLDLSDLASVKEFAESTGAGISRLDVLINNAGVMIPPLSHTKDGFELQMGTNHMGHFALTGALWPLLKATEESRVIVLASIGHTQGSIDFDDLDWKKRKYRPMQAYGDSKLANLYFAYELARRVDSCGPRVVAAHPGWTSTDLQRHSFLMRFLGRFFSQDVADGILPTLRAAFDQKAQPGDYYGPSGWQQFTGPPEKVRSSDLSRDEAIAAKLFTVSEQRTGIKFRFGDDK